MTEEQSFNEDVNREDLENTENIEDTEDGFEIEIVDDVDPQEKPRRPADAKPEIPDDGDLENYSEGVQKRLKKLTFEAREAARQQAEAQRLRDEALQYAQRLHAENERLQKLSQQGQEYAVSQGKARAEAQLSNAQAAYKAAYEAGDSDGLLKAQVDLTKAQNDLYRFENYRPPAPRAPAQQPAQPQTQPQAQAQPQLNNRQKAWLAENDWYGNNPEMTGYALGVHERLVKSGVDPDSDTYYSQIDAAVRQRFADEFSTGEEEVTPPPRKAQNVVTPAARSAQTPRRVKLTATQAAVAKKLGLTPQQYAAELLKLKGQENG